MKDTLFTVTLPVCEWTVYCNVKSALTTRFVVKIYEKWGSLKMATTVPVDSYIVFRRTWPTDFPSYRGMAQFGSALALGARGRGFESRYPDKEWPGQSDTVFDRPGLHKLREPFFRNTNDTTGVCIREELR